SPLNNLLPRIRGITAGQNRTFLDKHRDFQNVGRDAFVCYTLLPKMKTMVYVSDAAAIKEITADPAHFPKPLQSYGMLKLFSPNIIASEHDDWRRHRKAAALTFSELVLSVISATGFGRRLSWEEDSNVPPGYMMPFKDALHTVSSELKLMSLMPKWASGLTVRTRRRAQAFKELEMYMHDIIHNRKSIKGEERHDLLSNLLDANAEESEGRAGLSDSEPIADIFVFLIAGHETTVHTLCFAFALLALYHYEQERLYEDIKKVSVDADTMPEYKDMACYSVFYETLHMFPPSIKAGVIPKYSTEDTSLTIGNAHGESRTISIARNTGVAVHVPGLHYNPGALPHGLAEGAKNLEGLRD
ncbi:hypothetical protein EVG20_g11578, partial [Dentipellis fragilis]